MIFKLKIHFTFYLNISIFLFMIFLFGFLYFLTSNIFFLIISISILFLLFTLSITSVCLISDSVIIQKKYSFGLIKLKERRIPLQEIKNIKFQYIGQNNAFLLSYYSLKFFVKDNYYEVKGHYYKDDLKKLCVLGTVL